MRRRTAAAVTSIALPLLALTGCGSGDPAAGQPAGAASAAPSADVVGKVREDPALAKLLPAEVRERGTLRLASSVGAPPSAFHPSADSDEPAGQDIDIADAVGRVLGVKLERQEASFEAILPALESGKFDVGTGNFGVTEERLRTIDFVTYINDGQGFSVRKDERDLKKVTSLVQLCGKAVGVGAGTTFETTLEERKGVCAEAGKKPYEVKVYSENAAALTSLQQRRIDVIMSTINGLRYQAAQPAAGVKFLGEFQRLDVGFALKKGSPLAKAFRAAVNKLIDDGTYDRILKKWGTEKSALTESRINPPEVKAEKP
ncbi:ABC transporter substrate-binding protein [Streptomyces boluensis]|uniref:Transporter substrate-binding domain-containing protein n=1 Tax=Streptomyces boluensis TaxID=1775135 RepID=A0A964XNG0_9ACTN|nr:ABC transporter substrate-binding protein [Streptomyces boluensis]NBE53752.1 transporter substrate-binding domain-containing protein [Streptomyces boluensis]